MIEKNKFAQGIRVSYITLVLNSILAVIKLLAGFLANSSAMIADGVHTLSDIFSTIIVIISLKISSKKPDHEHQYGHDRFELIFSKILSVVLILSGLWIAYQSINLIISKNIEIPGNFALVAAILSIVTKELMFKYTLKVAKDIDSVSMEADAWHHRSDALSSIGTLIGVGGAILGFPIMDPLAGLVVSALIIKVGFDIYMKSIRGLVDEAADDEVIENILGIIESVEGVKSVGELKTRIFGTQIYVDVNIKVDGCITVHEGHDIASIVHDKIEQGLSEVRHVMVHVEPYQDEFMC